MEGCVQALCSVRAGVEGWCVGGLKAACQGSLLLCWARHVGEGALVPETPMRMSAHNHALRHASTPVLQSRHVGLITANSAVAGALTNCFMITAPDHCSSSFDRV